MTDRREVRLKPEYAAFYAGLRPGVWYSAAWLSARQFARTRCDGEAVSIAEVLNDQHFEFRGGASAAPQAAARQRIRAGGGGSLRWSWSNLKPITTTRPAVDCITASPPRGC